jgi:membrane protein DedA with SNARE-associated domain
VIVGGFFSSIGVLSYVITLIYVIVGIWIGEMFAYLLGEKYGMPFLQKYGKYVMVSPETLEHIQTLLRKNATWGILFSKFYSWTRGFFPFMAGVAKVPFLKLSLLSFLSSIARGLVFVSAGYLLGESYELIADRLGAFATRGLVLGTGIALLFGYFNSEYHLFKKSFSWIMVGDILSLLLFCLIAQKIYLDKLSFVAVDSRFQQLLLITPAIDTCMLRIHQVVTIRTVGVVGLAILIYLYRKKLSYYFAVFVSSMISA